MRDADAAMYWAKANGKTRYEIYDPSMDGWALGRLDLQAQVRRAVDRQEFELCYQPKVWLATGAIVGMEALVRWRQPARRLLLPGEFIALAEETGLILPLGQQVLRLACLQAKELDDRDPACARLTMSVNLSARQFRDSALVEDVQRVLHETGLAANRLQLEITESVAMDDAAAAAITMEKLRSLGVRLAIDDIGTGYSSLGYLERFEVDTLKIDRSFVAELGVSRGKTAIVRAVIEVSHELGIAVVAEGIETEEHVRELRLLGCETEQGYYYSRRLPAEGLVPLLTPKPQAATPGVMALRQSRV